MGQSITITEKAYEILKRVKKEVKARDGECTLSGAVLELYRISTEQKEFDKLTKEMLKQSEKQ